MRILFLSHRFPYPPTFGSKVRAFQVIKHLARQHEVTVWAPAHSAAEQAAAAGIAAHCHSHRVYPVQHARQLAKVAFTLPSTVSASEAYFHSGAMQRDVERELARRSYDFAFVHCSSVGRYVPTGSDLPKMIDYCDVDSRKWYDFAAHKRWPLSLGYRWEGWRVQRAERRLGGLFDQVTVATPGEVRQLRDIGMTERVDWFANGVDFDHFAPDGSAYDEDLIGFVGRMDYFPNEQCMVDFCRTVWPRLRAARPRLRLQIIGADPTPKVQALGRLAGVQVTGEVPDVRPLVRRCALTVSPLSIARGTQNKILESMALGVPVVTSRIAATGVDALPGEHLLAADGVQQTADAVLELLGDARLRARLAAAGRARVRSHHSWAAAMTRLDGIMGRCFGPRAQAQSMASVV
jgi:sugar transferase (PEP-CTERM/EpsH1 system associated)